MTTERYYDEYTPSAPTERIGPGAIVASAADDTPAWLPRDTRPLTVVVLVAGALVIAGTVWRASIFAAGFKAGAIAGYAAGVVQPWVDARGWIALLFIAIGVPIFAIYRSNRTYTYPEQP
jgi:hypothetical protein